MVLNLGLRAGDCSLPRLFFIIFFLSHLAQRLHHEAEAGVLSPQASAAAADLSAAVGCSCSACISAFTLSDAQA